MAKKIKTTKKEKISKAEIEKIEILAKTDKVKGQQLTIDNKGKLESKRELKDFAIGTVENPKKKYDVYYKGISKLLIKHLPKGKDFEKSRDFIYEEKNVYLSRGHRKDKLGIRGADGRMGYISDAEEILKVVMDWILSNGTMVELYNTLRDLNNKKGYGVREF
jgi:hypothetical protein